MRRAMETAIHMFKNHPNAKRCIKFVVLPIAREIIHTICDIAIDYDQLIEMYGKKDENGDYTDLQFDYSRFFLYGIPQLW